MNPVEQLKATATALQDALADLECNPSKTATEQILRLLNINLLKTSMIEVKLDIIASGGQAAKPAPPLVLIPGRG